MAIYTVHKRPGDPSEKAVFVADGFSFGAFVLTVVWALWKRMWLVAALLLLIEGGIALAARHFGIPDVATALANFAVALIFGFEAHDLWRRSLIASGKSEVGISAGERQEEAELRYFAGLPPAALSAPAVPPKARGTTHDTLGLFGDR
jgi:hypothetical protein